MCDLNTPIAALGGVQHASLLDNLNAEPMIALTLCTVVAVVAIVTQGVRSVLSSRALETSRREIAAYVAEGTIDPDKASALLEAGKRRA